jgi:hypothetical protein
MVVIPSRLRKIRKVGAVFSDYLLPAGIALLFVGLWVKSQAIAPQQHSRYRVAALSGTV